MPSPRKMETVWQRWLTNQSGGYMKVAALNVARCSLSVGPGAQAAKRKRKTIAIQAVPSLRAPSLASQVKAQAAFLTIAGHGAG